jgi:hypothetical protein
VGQTGGGYVAGATGVVAWLRPEHRIHAARGPASPKIFHSPKGGTPLQRGPTFTPSSPWPRSAPVRRTHITAGRDIRPKFPARARLNFRGQPQAVPHVIGDSATALSSKGTGTGQRGLPSAPRWVSGWVSG